MRRFLKDVIVYISIILLFNMLIFFAIRPLYDDSSYLCTVIESDPTTEVFILSDSHGTKLDSETLQEAGITNLSIGSDSYSDMYEKTKYIIDNFNAKAIIISVDAHTLSKYRESSNNNDLSGLLNETKGNFVSLASAYFPLLNTRYRDLFKAFVLSRFEAMSNRMQPSKDTSHIDWVDAPNKEEVARSRFQYQFPTGSESELLRNDLQRIIDLCGENSIRLIGIRYPLAQIYQNMLIGHDYGAKEIFVRQSLPVFDYETIFDEKDNYFSDPDHVNTEGGLKLSQFLVEDVLEYLRKEEQGFEN